MTGFLVSALVGVWMAVSLSIAARVARWIPRLNWRPLVGILVFFVFMSIPVADEIVGGFQFRALCRDGATLKIDAQKAKGKIVKSIASPSNEILHGTAIAINHSHIIISDVRTGDEIAIYERYAAEGGWLIRALGISESNSPLTLGEHSCSPINAGTLDKQFGFEYQHIQDESK